jgi:hypothetical protein
MMRRQTSGRRPPTALGTIFNELQDYDETVTACRKQSSRVIVTAAARQSASAVTSIFLTVKCPKPSRILAQNNFRRTKSSSDHQPNRAHHG